MIIKEERRFKVKEEEKLLELLVAAHVLCLDTVEPRLFFRGTKYSVRGRQLSKGEVEELESNIPIIDLLSEDSTPKEVIILGKAGRHFRESVHRLLDTGQPFYTQLNQDWNVKTNQKGPIFIWDHVKQVPFLSSRLPY